MFLRTKEIGNYKYIYLEKSFRDENGVSRNKSKYIGKPTEVTIEEIEEDEGVDLSENDRRKLLRARITNKARKEILFSGTNFTKDDFDLKKALDSNDFETLSFIANL